MIFYTLNIILYHAKQSYLTLIKGVILFFCIQL